MQIDKYLIDTKEKINFAIHLINKYQKHDKVNLVRTCENLIELNLNESVAALIAKQSTLDEEKRIEA